MSNCHYHHQNHDHPQLLQLQSSLPLLFDNDDDDGGGDENDFNDDDGSRIVIGFCNRINWIDGQALR